MKPILIMAVAVALGACASVVPESLRQAPADSPALTGVRANPQVFAGRAVYWGGTLAAIENLAAGTLLEVVERPLGDSGRPRETDRSGGRFLIESKGFLDPAIFTSGREVTVIGTLAGSRERKIGERPYDMPLVSAERLHLWSPRVEAPLYDPLHYGPYPWPYHYPYYSPFAYPYPYGPYWWPRTRQMDLWLERHGYF